MVAEGSVGLAFGLTIGSGLATSIGASFALCAKLSDKRLLASALAISAGVMIYVSFVEIFATKSFKGFRDAGISSKNAYLYGTLSFFGGVIMTILLDKFVHLLGHSDHDNEFPATPHAPEPSFPDRNPAGIGEGSDPIHLAMGEYLPVHESCLSVHVHEPEEFSTEPGTGKDPKKPPSMPPSIPSHPVMVIMDHDAGPAHPTPSSVVALTTFPAQAPLQAMDRAPSPGATSSSPRSDDLNVKAKHELKRMGLMTALAVSIHNFPEGLATFVAALADSSVGVTIAIAIAIHNIPEGVCVAMPVYYATGSRLKGFLWSVMVGISEPIGALLGYAVLANHFNDLVFGIVFGVVAGMMVYISTKELLPTARKYDPDDKVVSFCFVLGMAVMAASLVLFSFK